LKSGPPLPASFLATQLCCAIELLFFDLAATFMNFALIYAVTYG
jgi:hypothetical protein